MSSIHPRKFYEALAVGAPRPMLEYRKRLERMVHFISPHDPKMIARIPGLIKTADAILGNLEDNIPFDMKEAARAGFIKMAQDHDFGETTLWTRINDLRSPWVIDDITQIVTAVGNKIDVIMIPKVERAEHIRHVDWLVAHAEAKGGVKKAIMLHAILETAEGFKNVAEIAAASPRMHGISFGPADFAADMKLKTTQVGGVHPRFRVVADETGLGKPRPTYQQDPWTPFVTDMVAACRAAGIKPFYGPYGNVKDDAGCEMRFMNSAILGCDGAWSLHPDQLEIARKAFSPDPKDIVFALKVMAALPDGRGGVAIDGKFADDAVWKQCWVFIDLALQVVKKEPQMGKVYFDMDDPERHPALIAVRQAQSANHG